MLYSCADGLMPFHYFWLVVFVLVVLFFCCFFAWMRTAILAGGIAVVRSGFLLCFAEDGELVLDFLFIYDWIIGSNSA